MPAATKPRELLASAYLMDASRSRDDSHVTPTRFAMPCSRSHINHIDHTSLFQPNLLLYTLRSKTAHAMPTRCAVPCENAQAAARLQRLIASQALQSRVYHLQRWISGSPRGAHQGDGASLLSLIGISLPPLLLGQQPVHHTPLLQHKTRRVSQS